MPTTDGPTEPVEASDDATEAAGSGAAARSFGPLPVPEVEADPDADADESALEQAQHSQQ